MKECITRVPNPCKPDCPKRSGTCHIDCPAYQAYAVANELRRQENLEQQQLRSDCIDARRNIVKAYRRNQRR